MCWRAFLFTRWGGRSLPCAEIRGTRLCSSSLPMHSHTHTRVCSLAPCSAPDLSAMQRRSLPKDCWHYIRQFWRKSRGAIEHWQERGKKWEESRVQGNISQWAQRKKRWWLSPVEIFKANEAKGSVQKINSKPNSLVVKSYSWAHFIRKSRVIPFFLLRSGYRNPGVKISSDAPFKTKAFSSPEWIRDFRFTSLAETPETPRAVSASNIRNCHSEDISSHINVMPYWYNFELKKCNSL